MTRCVVFAYHEIGYVGLECLLELGAEIPLVITHEDDPDERIWFRSVRALAESRGLPVFTPPEVNAPEWVERVRASQPDFLFSFYYRRLLKTPLLAVPTRGALNLHGALLPRYRGRCPVNWVLIHDERETGVTLHYMTEKPDAGDIVAQRAVPIDDSDTAWTLFQKLTEAAAQLLRDTLPLLFRGLAPRIPQDPSLASYFGGRRPEDGRIDWRWTARRVFNLVRAVTHPYPGAFAQFRGAPVFVWQATPVERRLPAQAEPGRVLTTQPELLVACSQGAVRLDCVSDPGEKELSGPEWAVQKSLVPGDRFE